MIIIPARLKSTRLPYKVVKTIGNKTMIEHTIDYCKAANIGPVIVATDSESLAVYLKGKADEIIRTSSDCKTGMDRVQQATEIMNLDAYQRIVAVQADLPFGDAHDLIKLYEHIVPEVGEIQTLIKLNSDYGNIDPSKVKVTTDKFNKILYMSRLPLPYDNNSVNYLEHIGIYGMTVKVLKKFTELTHNRLERAEDIEGIRALENNIEMYGIFTNYEYIGVNTAADLQRARFYCKELEDDNI